MFNCFWTHKLQLYCYPVNVEAERFWSFWVCTTMAEKQTMKEKREILERALWEIYFTKSLRNELQSSNYLYRINTSRTFQRL